MTSGKGVLHLRVTPEDFPLSDDSMLNGATARALVCHASAKDDIVRRIASELVLARTSDPDRCYGPGSMAALRRVASELEKGVPLSTAFDPRGGGCGAVMRSCCIGLYFPLDRTLDSKETLMASPTVKKLVAVAADVGRITHRHPTGYLGAVCGAFFTALALQRKHKLVTWGRLLLDVAVPLALEHVSSGGVDVEANVKAAEYFKEKWEAYLKLRNIRVADSTTKPTFPEKYGVKERDRFYSSVSFSGWGGASGHDAPMIAYDALLSGGEREWNTTVYRAMLHAGDSDSTGILAGSWYGAMNGFQGVPESHSHCLEYGAVLMRLGVALCDATMAPTLKKDRGCVTRDVAASADDFETHLQKLSKASVTPTVQMLLSKLQETVVYVPGSGNVETNRKLWDRYAKEWSPQTEWVKRMAGHLPSESGESPEKLKHVGDEWSDTKSLEEVVDSYIRPFVSADSAVAEIGSGGGRVAWRACGLENAPKSLHCFDISKEMLKRARETLSHPSIKTDVKYCLLKDEGAGLGSEKWSGMFDFVYSFDVFVHVDLHTMWKYFRYIRCMLKPDTGRAFVSTANLTSPGGWARFEKQKKFTVGGFYFVTPDIVRTLVRKSGLEIVKESVPSSGNIYYNRDYLIVLKAAGVGAIASGPSEKVSA